MANELTVVNETSVNPFGGRGPSFDGLLAGNAAIESERAIAEAQGALTMARRFPRDQGRAYGAIMETCKRKAFAETASYAFPRGGQTVSGPSIRLAEELARAWGNIDYGIRELSRGEGFSEMEAYAWDLETNTRTAQRFVVRHKSLAKTAKDLVDERDIYERVANDGSRRLRARILAILPPDLVDAAEEECKRTLAGNNGEPIIERARRMIAAFAKLGVLADHIQARLGHTIETSLPEEFAELQQIFASIRDGMTRASDWFGAGANAELPAAAGKASADAVTQALAATPTAATTTATRKPRAKVEQPAEIPSPTKPEVPPQATQPMQNVPSDFPWPAAGSDIDI